MSKRVTKWESDDGKTYDTQAEAKEADIMNRVYNNLDDAGFDWKIAEPIATRYSKVLECIQSAIKSKGKPAKRVCHE
jgi:hypothetical protein